MINFDVEFKKLCSEYIKVDGNLIMADRLFMVNSIYRFLKNTNKELKVYPLYFEHMKKHLSGEIELFWDGDLIKVRREYKG